MLLSVKNRRRFLPLVGVCLAPSDAGQEGAQSTASTCPPGEDAQPLLWPEGTNWPHSYKLKPHFVTFRKMTGPLLPGATETCHWF